MSATAMKIRARGKRFEDLPEKALCCEMQRQVMKISTEKQLVWEVELGQAHDVNVKCPYCGAEQVWKAVYINGTKKGQRLLVDLHDFDEGGES